MTAFYDKRTWKEVSMGRRNLVEEKHWEPLFVEDYAITKPTVICLGGNATIDTFEANGFCKQAENMLGLIKRGKGENISDRVDLLGFGYARRDIGEETGDLPISFVDEFVDRVLLPLFLENGKRVSLDMAKRNMSKISFFTYCQGQREANKIMDSLDLRLSALGYTDIEIDDINNSTLNVAFAPLDDKSNYMPTVRVLSIRDERVGSDVLQILDAQEIASLDGICVRTDEAGMIYGTPRKRAISGSINVISSQLLNATGKILDEHLSSIVSRNDDWLIRKFANNEGDLVVSGNADCVSQIMSYALGSAIENGEKNMTAETYVPNTFYTTLPEELSSIVAGFSKKSLQVGRQKKWQERETGYNSERYQKINDWSKNYFTFSKPQSVIFYELKEAKTFIQVASILEENNYNYMDEVMPAIKIPLSDSQRFLLQVGARFRKENMLKRKWECEPDAVINSSLSKAKTFDEIKTILSCFDYVNAQRFARVLLSRSDNIYPITKSEIDTILQPLKVEYASRPEKVGKEEYFRRMADELEHVDIGKDTFCRIAEILEKYEYYAVSDMLPMLRDKLSKEEHDDIMCMRRAKIVGEEERRGKISCLRFGEMVDLINSAESFEDAIIKYARYGFCGAKYVLPEVLVLTDDEKSQIMEMEYSEKQN